MSRTFRRVHARLMTGAARWRLLGGLVVALCLLAVRIDALGIRPTLDVVVDNDHDGIDDQLEQKLADRFAPLLFIEPDESNYPVNVEWFLARAHLQYHEDCFSDTDDDTGPNPIFTQANLIGPPWAGGPNCGEDDTGYSHPPHRRLTTIATDPDGQVSAGAATTGYSDQQTFVLPDLADAYKVGSSNPQEWVTYFHVYPSAAGGVMIQYWHIFAYNELSVLGFGRHGGDWDASIQVQLDRNLHVTGVWFSRHANDHPGDFFSRDRVHFYGDHPLMTIDGGGHAAFKDADDFCAYDVPVGRSGSWPSDLSDPTNPAKLGLFQSFGPFCSGPALGRGGVVWETWSDGLVKASGALTHSISAPSRHGGLLNLGEYNPCTRTTCNGSAQASTLLSGNFFPLNGQIFIRYEGKWGSLPSSLSPSGPPRGPVFQGFDDRGEGAVSVYTAWYNQGAANPASNNGLPWRVPPRTTLTFTGPAPTIGGEQYISGATTIVLTATQSSIADEFGALTTYYRVYPIGGPAPPYTPYTAPFALAPPDGRYVIDDYSVDGLNNVEGELFESIDTIPPVFGIEPPSLVVTLDTTPPIVSISQPAQTTYAHSSTLTLHYSAADSGSGLDSLAATLDGLPTIAGHPLLDGQVINLLTDVSLGDHTFSVTAEDRVGNAQSSSVVFTVIATPESIKADVRQLLGGAGVPPGILTSLLQKLDNAAAQRAAGRCDPSGRMYQAFINELTAQAGKQVSNAAAQVMITDAQYLIAHCP